MKKPLLEEHLLKNIFFDTCVYHQPGINLLTEVIPVENILFASEMIGAVRGIDPRTGHYYDDTKRYVQATANLNDATALPGVRGQCASRCFRVWTRPSRPKAADGRGASLRHGESTCMNWVWSTET